MGGLSGRFIWRRNRLWRTGRRGLRLDPRKAAPHGANAPDLERAAVVVAVAIAMKVQKYAGLSGDCSFLSTIGKASMATLIEQCHRACGISAPRLKRRIPLIDIMNTLCCSRCTC